MDFKGHLTTPLQADDINRLKHSKAAFIFIISTISPYNNYQYFNEIPDLLFLCVTLVLEAFPVPGLGSRVIIILIQFYQESFVLHHFLEFFCNFLGSTIPNLE